MKDHSHPMPVPPPKCAHDLAFCEKSNGPYCKSCGQEWVTKPTGLLQGLQNDYERARQNQPKWPSLQAPYEAPKFIGVPNQTPGLLGYPGSIFCAHTE